MKKSPVMCISDPHFHNFKAFNTIDPSGMGSRLWHTKKAWEEAVILAKDKGCKLIVSSGDMFHIRGHLRPSVYNAVYDTLVDTVEAGLTVALIAGNHDLENYFDRDTAVDKLGGIEGVHVLDGTQQATLSGWNIVGIPYTHNPGKFKERYEAICSETAPDIILTHEYFDDYIPVVMGYRGIDIKFLRSHIKMSAFVVNGHQHYPEYLPGSHVLNVGSPLAQNFGDTADAYGCWIIDEGQEPEFHPLSGPKFLTVKSFKAGDEDKIRGNYVRVEAKTDKAAVTIRNKCVAAGALGVVSSIVKDFKVAPGATIKIGNKEKMIAEYADIIGGDIKARKPEVMALYNEVTV